MKKWIIRLWPAGLGHAKVFISALKAAWQFLQLGRLRRALLFFKVTKTVLLGLVSEIGLGPRNRRCPNCGWQGRAFLPIYYVDCFRENVFCPCCNSYDRYRTLVACSTHVMEVTGLWGNPFSGALDIAPLRFTEEMLKRVFGVSEVITFDLENPIAQLHGDIQALPFSDSKFDLVLCYEVLDYIPDDAKALSEIFRVLRHGRICLMRVGFDVTRETVELQGPDPEDSFHIRRYGSDLADRFTRAGFQVIPVYPEKVLGSKELDLYGAEAGIFFILLKPSIPGQSLNYSNPRAA